MVANFNRFVVATQTFPIKHVSNEILSTLSRNSPVNDYDGTLIWVKQFNIASGACKGMQLCVVTAALLMRINKFNIASNCNRVAFYLFAGRLVALSLPGSCRGRATE